MNATLAALLRDLRPRLHAGVWVFGVLPAGASPAGALATFHEAEGLSVVVREEEAAALGLAPVFRADRITLEVPSALDAVGLTAAVAGALAGEGISCNVIAAVHHDHLFVPAGLGARALDVLRRLSR